MKLFCADCGEIKEELTIISRGQLVCRSCFEDDKNER